MANPLQQRLQALLRHTPPAGLRGAAFWLAVWFLLCWLLRLAPGATGTFFGVVQVLVGIALVCVGLPLLWRIIRLRMLWSLRNKLILTYLLIGLAPIVLLLTLVTISTYIAAGQFSIHLADTRVQSELDQMVTGNAVRVARVVHILDTDSAPGSIESRTSEIAATERAAGSSGPRSRPDRHIEAFIDGAPVVEHTANLSH